MLPMLSCVIVASEGAQFEGGQFLAESGGVDAFGHAQLGGVAPTLVDMIKTKLGYKCHWAVSDYLQRAARHVASDVDVKQAYAIGYKALSFAKSQINGVMLTINKKNTSTYQWNIGITKLSDVANVEKILPKSFITKDGFGITSKCKKYIGNLIKGENYPPYKNGLPDYAKLKHPLVKKKLKKFS
jgi:6-phosphofructokinase 1